MTKESIDQNISVKKFYNFRGNCLEKMVFLTPKIPMAYPPYRIYRGNDPELIRESIKKSENFFDKMGSIEAKLGWAFSRSLVYGLIYSLMDIKTLSRITERKAQISRTIFFTAPAVCATVGWVAGMEVLNKVLGPQKKQQAYAFAAVVPAGVYCTWRRRVAAFPRAFIPIALIGWLYQKSIDENMYFGFGSAWENPNDPKGQDYRNNSLFNEAIRYEGLRTMKLRGLCQGVDPGPTYAKFEEK